LNAGPDGRHGSSRLVPQSSRELWFFEIETLAKHRLGPVEPECLDIDLHLATAWRRYVNLLNPQDFRPTGLVKLHDSRHG
jgi:hypothetical protein